MATTQIADDTTGDMDIDMKEEEEVLVEPALSNVQQSDPEPIDTDPARLSQTPSAANDAQASNAAPSADRSNSTAPVPAAASPMPPSIASIAASTRPGSMPPQPTARPEKPIAHGGPTRQYLNMNVTPHLLEGMKHLAAHEPEKPLLWLADFLRDKSKEVEGP
jgi:COMPASS component SDC1